MMHRENFMMMSWHLSTIIVVKPSSCTVQVVVEKLLFATLSQLLFCAQGKIALCVASSGTASLLLEGGRTAHSTFKIPLQVNHFATSLDTQMHMLSCNKPPSLFGMKSPCRTSMLLMLLTEHFRISWEITYHLVA